MANYTATAQLIANDPLLKDFSYPGFPNQPASSEVVERTKKALESNTHKVTVVKNKKEALEAIKKIIPKGSSVSNAGSTTLWEIGYVDHAKTQTDWESWFDKIQKETDPKKQTLLKEQSQHADYFLTSVPALTENGELTICCASGSRSGPILYSARNVIVVAGTNKIVPNLEKAFERQRKIALPIESARVRIAYGLKGSVLNFSGVVHGSLFSPGRFHVILVEESLGF